MGIADIAAGSRKGKERKKKPDELLSSVIRETAIGAAVGLLKGNEKFVFPSGTAWVMLTLSSEAVGGLSRRQNRDSAKGSIIKLIESDQIETVATAEMLGEEVFGIIPTPSTLERMDEYSLLTTADYSWAVVWQSGEGDLHVEPVSQATFDQAKQVSAGLLSLEQAVGEQAWADHSGVADLDPSGVSETADRAVTEEVDVVSDVDEGDPLFDEAIEGGDSFDEDEPVFDDVVDTDEPVFLDETPEDSASEDVGPVQPETLGEDETSFDEVDDEDEYASAISGSEDWEQDGVYAADQEQASAAIARRFLSEDIDLGIRLDEFNATFAIGAPAVRIDVPEGATEWLGDQIAQLNRQANADLAGLRYQHEDELRALYVNLMGTHIEQVIRAVAPDREGSRYKELMSGLERRKEEAIAGKDDKVRAAKAAVVEAHEKHIAAVSEKAARDAEVHYRERNRTRIEREQADAAAEVQQAIEAAYTDELSELLRIRRNDAGLKLQVGQTEIFKVLTERHKSNLDAEQERLDKWKDEIQRIVADNRSNDVARANALAEQLARTDELGAAREEHRKALEAQRIEFEDRTRRMDEELQRSYSEAEARLATRDAEWGRDLGVERERVEQLGSQLRQQREENAQIKESVKAQYEQELADLRADRQAFVQEIERASVMQGHYSRLVLALLVGLPLFVGVAAFLLGWAL